MIGTHLGEVYALITAICWTFSATSFELAGKKIGSLSLNFIRLVIGFLLISTYTAFSRGMIFPLDATLDAWIWLSISGIIGFVIGDLFLFMAFSEIGSRISMLIMAISPPITALLGFFIMGEVISISDLIGMSVTILGIALVIIMKDPENNSFKLSHSIKGIIYALVGALGQSLGIISSKLGMGSYDPFAASQIRIIAGIIGFAIVIMFMKKWDGVVEGIKNKEARKYLLTGSFFGPFLGVSLSLMSIQYITTGVSSTITSIIPVLIIPLSILVLKEKVSPKEIFGAFVTVIGVVILFMI